MSHIDDPRVISAFRELLKDPSYDSSDRRLIIMTLKKTSDVSIIPDLANFLKDEDLKIYAYESLAGITKECFGLSEEIKLAASDLEKTDIKKLPVDYNIAFKKYMEWRK